METEELNLTSVVELTDVSNVLNSFSNIDEETKLKILTELSEKAQAVKSILEDVSEETKSSTKEEPMEEKEQTPKVKKQWGILLSDPNHTLTQEYMGWCFQMDEDDNIADATDRIIAAAGDFNRSKKGSKNPVGSIGEAIMYVPSKIFKEQKIYIKHKDPVYINVTDNSLVSKNA